jgi:dinuclear metal center YbgI/SA1388 family protein
VTTVADLVTALDERFPFADAASWDPVGLQLGWPDRPVGRVAVCHEATPGIVGRSIANGIDTVVSYHPLLFREANRLIGGPGPEGRALSLAEAGVSLVVVHTAMDAADPGTGDALLAAIGLVSSGRWAFEDDAAAAIGRWGILDEPHDARALADHVGRALGCTVRVTPADREIRRIAVLPGSGGRFLASAHEVADAVVTGDVSHHAAISAAERGVCVIDAGHAATERPAMGELYAAVCEVVGEVDHFDDDPTPWEV